MNKRFYGQNDHNHWMLQLIAIQLAYILILCSVSLQFGQMFCLRCALIDSSVLNDAFELLCRYFFSHGLRWLVCIAILNSSTESKDNKINFNDKFSYRNGGNRSFEA